MLKFKPKRNKTGEFETQFLTLSQSGFKPKYITQLACPTCRVRVIKRHPGKEIGRCHCGHIHSFLYPFPIQKLFSIMQHRLIGMIGGTGSGKTTASALLFSQMMRNVPGVKIYAFAGTEQQLTQTGKEELNKFFLDDEWQRYNANEWIHKNGSQVIWYTSKDEGKLRGVNAGWIWLIEASEIPHGIFTQAQTRLRQKVLKVMAHNEDGSLKVEYSERTGRYEAVIESDRVGMVIETNPTFEWPRDRMLMQSHTVIHTPSVRGVSDVKKLCKPVSDPENPNKVLDLITIMFASPDNPLMSEEYLSTIRTTSVDKEAYERDIYCDMSFTKGMVFGDILEDIFVSGETPPTADGENTYFVEGMDPGGSNSKNDATGYLFGTITFNVKGKDYPVTNIFDGFKLNGKTQEEVAAEMWKIRNRWGWTQSKAKFFVGDPSAKKQDHNKNSYERDMKRFQIYIDTKVNNDIGYGLIRIETLAKAGCYKVHINEGTAPLVQEIKGYMWAKNTVTSKTTKRKEQRPVDKENHTIDPWRYIAVKVPFTQAQQNIYMNRNGYQALDNGHGRLGTVDMHSSSQPYGSTLQSASPIKAARTPKKIGGMYIP